jgi:hypothetical protein
MNALRLCLLLLVAPLSPTLVAESARLGAEAEPADVAILPAETGDKLLRLPDLAYQISIDAHCRNSDRAESLSISAADTRMTLLRDEIADRTSITVGITIPASQVAPLAADDFCKPDGRDDPKRLVKDAFTAHISLRCSGDEGESIIYTTRPLAVVLTCDRETQGDAEDAGSPILR